jgi:hypothetical protein
MTHGIAGIWDSRHMGWQVYGITNIWDGRYMGWQVYRMAGIGYIGHIR